MKKVLRYRFYLSNAGSSSTNSPAIFLPSDCILYLAVFNLTMTTAVETGIRTQTACLVVGNQTVILSTEREKILAECRQTEYGTTTPDGSFDSSKNFCVAPALPIRRGTELSLYQSVNGNTVGTAVLQIYLNPTA